MKKCLTKAKVLRIQEIFNIALREGEPFYRLSDTVISKGYKGIV